MKNCTKSRHFYMPLKSIYKLWHLLKIISVKCWVYLSFSCSLFYILNLYKWLSNPFPAKLFKITEKFKSTKKNQRGIRASKRPSTLVVLKARINVNQGRSGLKGKGYLQRFCAILGSSTLSSLILFFMDFLFSRSSSSFLADEEKIQKCYWKQKYGCNSRGISWY